ncbi:MAG: hypothetical protein ACRDJW_01375 [Thermomicrobiales bacterium]
MNEPHLFTLIRRADESGVSGTGRVLDGVVFHTGQVVVCWRSDLRSDAAGFSSLAIYPSWEAFLHVHVRPHAEDATEIRFAAEANLETTD